MLGCTLLIKNAATASFRCFRVLRVLSRQGIAQILQMVMQMHLLVRRIKLRQDNEIVSVKAAPGDYSSST